MRKILGGLSEVGVCVRIRRVSFGIMREGVFISVPVVIFILT